MLVKSIFRKIGKQTSHQNKVFKQSKSNLNSLLDTCFYQLGKHQKFRPVCKVLKNKHA